MTQKLPVDLLAQYDQIKAGVDARLDYLVDSYRYVDSKYGDSLTLLSLVKFFDEDVEDHLTIIELLVFAIQRLARDDSPP